MHFNQKPRSLESVCTLITDGSHFSPAPQVEGYPIVNAKDIPSGYINLDSCTNISKDDWDTLRKQNCAPAPGDVLLSKDGTIGRVVFYEYDLCVVALSSIAILRPNDSIDPNYLAQVLRSDAFRRQLLVLESGSALKRIILRDIKKLEFYFPDYKSEQTKIAEILSTVDRAIEQTEALIAKQQRIKTGLMQDLLTRGIDEHGNLRSEQTHEFKDSPLGRIPVEWKSPIIDELAVRVGSGVTPRGGESVYTKGGVLFIRSQNVHFGGLLLADVSYISQKIHDTMKRSEVFENDVLLNITGASIGRCCPMPAINCTANVNQHVCAIRLSKATQSDAGFLTAVIESSIGQNQILQFNAGGNREGLNYQQVRSFVIPWPKAEERQRLHTVIKESAEALKVSGHNLEKLRSLKTALMQDLLTGKKRVTALLTIVYESDNGKGVD